MKCESECVEHFRGCTRCETWDELGEKGEGVSFMGEQRVKDSFKLTFLPYNKTGTYKSWNNVENASFNLKNDE